ncbi:MAG: TRAP transporter small permease subunit [Hydrogenophaga sp.]|uniref:TRAP transporter small permease n=1 Tax=Hydrogenophaga sp. TaxID=1904254 RepID=UPI001BC2EE6C|nr:TRAP transporter small permease subunit [Hydrogenophaga sp.]MBS3910962.1 TRAP transporter small permease subunit [Hydrogenophaga sp.]MDO9149468.1 TRAP transporter small permease subunit [Hydrogenophaga sp.]MDO9606843.1 TRAP transporter small permease subunit [Hydrogenophaga sp.]MDP2166317.1 TRAP transporter small permease subunit [Hydrogenophaga sp.]MDP3475801.1 TRAP transporter small permease subunit [Hydrogenophaga sp.]
MPLYAPIQTLDRWLMQLERGAVIALTAGIAGIMMTQVVMRYFFSAPIFWAEEISVQLLVFVTLFGLSLLVQGGQLVSIDFLPAALPERARHALMTVLGAVLLALLLFLAVLGWEWVNRPEVRMELGATTQLPRWYNYAALPLAMACMAFHQFAAILRHARALLKGAAA